MKNMKNVSEIDWFLIAAEKIESGEKQHAEITEITE